MFAGKAEGKASGKLSCAMATVADTQATYRKMAKDIQKAEKVLAKAQLALHVAGDPAINAAFNKLAKVARILELAAQKGPGSPVDYTDSEDSLSRSRSPRRHADGPASG